MACHTPNPCCPGETKLSLDAVTEGQHSFVVRPGRRDPAFPQIGFVTFYSYWTRVNTRPGIENDSQFQREIALGYALGAPTHSAAHFYPTVRSKEDVLYLSELGIVSHPDGRWEEGTFSVPASTEGLEIIDHYFVSRDLSGVASSLKAMAEMLKNEPRSRRRTYGRWTAFRRAAKPFLGSRHL